MFTCVSQYHSI